MKILDGGFGRELARRGAPFRQPEWSALALTEAPDIVKQVHLDFIQAGAEVITTNNYAVVPFHIGEQRFANEVTRLVKEFVLQDVYPHYLVHTVPIYLKQMKRKH